MLSLNGFRCTEPTSQGVIQVNNPVYKGFLIPVIQFFFLSHFQSLQEHVHQPETENVRFVIINSLYNLRHVSETKSSPIISSVSNITFKCFTGKVEVDQSFACPGIQKRIHWLVIVQVFWQHSPAGKPACKIPLRVLRLQSSSLYYIDHSSNSIFYNIHTPGFPFVLSRHTNNSLYSLQIYTFSWRRRLCSSKSSAREPKKKLLSGLLKW